MHLSRDKSLMSWVGGVTGFDSLGRGVPGAGKGVGGFQLLCALIGELAFKRGAGEEGERHQDPPWGPSLA